MLSALVSVSSLSLSDEEKRWLEKYQPAGVSLFARNIRDADQLRRLTGEIRAAAGRDDILIAVDQEGGRVRRLSGSDFHPAASQYVLGQLDEEMAAAHAEIISNDLRRTGINFNFSPVLDMAYPATHPVLKSRCFGSSEQKTALLGKAMISAYLSNGGKSFICMSSTVTGKDGTVKSRIVPTLTQGSICTDPRSCGHYVVTEYGMINLKGLSTWERAEAIISIAHPDFREQLIADAEKMHIWRRSNK